MKLPRWRRHARPKVKTPEDRMTLRDHLAELRTRIIRCALAVGLGVVVMMAFYDQVLSFLLQPYQNLCERKGEGFCNGELFALGPLEGFNARLRISLYGGLVLAFPVLLWQIWRFVVPGLHSKEKKYAVPFLTSMITLFVLGGLVAYWTFDKALEWLIAWSGTDVNQTFQITKYVSLLVLLVLAFGVGFEFPVLLVFLQLVGVITPNQLLKQWRYAIMSIFVIAAVITPSGDPISLMMLAIPMTILYALSVGIGFLVQRRRSRVAATA